MRIAALVTLFLAALLARPAISAEQFKDVPKDHWAAESVQIVKADGVMKGYPDATFKGDKPVTRYELAVALERMIAFIEQGLKPEVKGQKLKVESQGTKAQDPAEALKSGGFIPANSPLLTNRDRTVSPAELAQALSSVASRLVEKTIPPPKDGE
jgi:hypothetical protein